MKSKLAQGRIQHLLKQRNMVLVACSALLLTNFIQALIVLLTLLQKTRHCERRQN